jgi:small subunit ribosomal protein S19e
MMYDVDQGKLIEVLASELKRQHVVSPPDWAPFAKTGTSKDRPPVDDDWWYTRAASVLRTVYRLGPIGTAKLRVKYGGRKNRGYAPDKFFPAGGNHLRKILQQLETAKLIKQEAKGVHKGRVITPLGRKLLHAVAGVVKAQEAASAPKQMKEASSSESKTENPAESPVAGE